MTDNLKIEDVFIQVRNKLQKDNVKLWLEPYYNEERGSSEEDLKSLSKEYSTTLHLKFEECFAALSELQSNAIEKLKQRDRFKESGIATVKIKLLNQTPPKLLTKEVLLSSSGLDLKQQICSNLSVPVERFKLICSGLVLKDNENLFQQGVKNGTQILALLISESLTSIQEEESRFKDIETTKEDTSLLAADTSYMQLEDQDGNIINIPPKEKKALMIAMALHEKGRSALKKQDFARALVFFLDADREFSQCNSQLLNSVDNYALLDLDIAWCYLCLQSFVHLPEAFQRLNRCEKMFQKSYGPNLERLVAVKGSAGNEAALFMRLHLLQAIVLYHQNNREEALNLFKKSQEELRRLKVDDNKIMTLVELGYSTAEARMGLRVTNGDLNAAAIYITENRNKRSEARKKAIAEKLLEKEKRKLGKCIDGQQYVNPQFLNMLVGMGYSRHAAQIALKQTNNVISDSIQYIQEHPQAGPSSTRSQEFLAFVEELVPELTAAGFNETMAKLALQKHNCDIMKAAEELLSNNGIIKDNLDDALANLNVDLAEVDEEERKKKEDAWNRLAQDISTVDDDHLDLTLEKEEEFLQQYLSLLQ